MLDSLLFALILVCPCLAPGKIHSKSIYGIRVHTKLVDCSVLLYHRLSLISKAGVLPLFEVVLCAPPPLLEIMHLFPNTVPMPTVVSADKLQSDAMIEDHEFFLRIVSYRTVTHTRPTFF